MRTASRMVAISALVALAVATAWTVAPSPADAQSRTCRSQGSRTLLGTSAGRFFSKRSRVYACSSLYRKKFRLIEEDFQEDYRPLRLTRRFAAYGSLYSCAACDSSFADVNVLDLRTGRHRHRVSATPLTDAGQEIEVRVTDLVVTPGGAVAWIVDVNGTRGGQAFRVREVRARGVAGTRVLDSSPVAIGPESLELSGSTLSWVGVGGRRTAPLR